MRAMQRKYCELAKSTGGYRKEKKTYDRKKNLMDKWMKCGESGSCLAQLPLMVCCEGLCQLGTSSPRGFLMPMCEVVIVVVQRIYPAQTTH